MVRRTKEDALATRNHLLDTAERVFEQRGVSRTSLNEIARAAGVTRGAIYWHFRDKADLFEAMMQRVLLPLEEAMQTDCGREPSRALAVIREQMLTALRRIVQDAQLRRVFEIAIHKVEYVDELVTVRARRIEGCDGHMRRIEGAFAAAMEAGLIDRRTSPGAAALGLHALIDGLIQNWMLRPAAFDLVAVGTEVIDAYLAGYRLQPPAPLPTASGGLHVA